jgi:uncharacterized protein with GYD domain
MLFVTCLKFLPGQYEEGTRLCKHPKIPEGVEIKSFWGLFGKPDVIIIFEAKDESSAADFAVQFGRVAESSTSLALPIREFRWTW